MVEKPSRIIFLILAAFALTGCATVYNPATERNEFIMINSATEVALGKSAIPELTREHPLSKDASLNNRMQAIGSRVSGVSDRKDIVYNFYVLQDKELNALTLPGGYIYVNQGLANILNDDELAFVLGHEVGHVASRHIAKKIQANMAYQLILGVAFSTVADGAGTGAQNIAQGLDTVYQLVELSYSRKDEFQADELGAKYSLLAGFDPYAAAGALEKIKKEEGPNWKVLQYFRTHPYVDERIKHLNTIVPQLKVKRGLN